jgi:hypothetical protein
MAIDATKWRVNTDKSIDYIGGDHGTATANYITVLELHRWLMDIADDSSVLDHGDDDFMDITTLNPSDKSFATIINLVNGYYLSESGGTPAVEFVYGGSIIQNPGTGEQFYDGVSVVANRGVKVNVIQDEVVISNDFWNNVPDAEKTAATATVGTGSTGTTLEVSSTSEFSPGDVLMFHTVTDEIYMVDSITDANTLELTETLTTPPANGQAIYFATRGINPDPANGVAAQFMVKTKDSGTAVDNGTLTFTTREWFYTYSAFRIPSMSRGQNVVPLTYALDLNNTTALATAATWSTITNVTAGWNQIDVDDNSVDENYYSEWNRDTYNINQFYERMKYITRAGETTTLYGLPGEEFRGITHSVAVQAAPSPGAWTEGASINWDAGASTGQLLAYDTTSEIAYIQLTSGVVPGDSEVLTDGSNTATTLASNAVTERTIAEPFCGASTGSALIGAYGFSLELADLAVNDKIQALDGVTRSPPNIVQFSVGGIQSGYRILVGPEDGAGALDIDQLSVSGAVNGGAVTSITFLEDRPANTPNSGTVRLKNSDGKFTRHAYSAVTSDSPLTITITSHDFSGVGDDLVNGADAYISYIDRTATGTSESFSTVQTTTQTLYVEARFGGTGPDYTDSIKPAKSTGELGATGGSATLSPVSDA